MKKWFPTISESPVATVLLKSIHVLKLKTFKQTALTQLVLHTALSHKISSDLEERTPKGKLFQRGAVTKNDLSPPPSMISHVFG